MGGGMSASGGLTTVKRELKEHTLLFEISQVLDRSLGKPVEADLIERMEALEAIAQQKEQMWR